jgi:type IV secretion system protein VirD4
LAKLGKKLPTKKQLEDSWGSGECAVVVPLLNLDLHEAVVQARSRAVTVADVEQGIDLRALAVDFSKVPLPEGSGIEAEQVEAFVDGFFDALDAANGYEDDDAPDVDDDGASERPSDDELAALDAQADDDDRQQFTVSLVDADADENESDAVELVTSDLPPGGDVVAMPALHAQAESEPKRDDGLGHDQADMELDGPTDEDLAAMMDDFIPPDDGMMDEADMLAALDEMEAVPEYLGEDENDKPILDLSVLDKPLPSIKNTV